MTPEEFLERLGNYGQYCPVSLNDFNELIECSTLSMDFAVEYDGKYYKIANAERLERFLGEFLPFL